MDPVRDLELPLRRRRLALLVDQESDARGAELPGELHLLYERLLTVLEVDRVEDRAPRDPLEGFFEDGVLGRVDDERSPGQCGNPGNERRRVLHLVASDVGEHDVEGVDLLGHLLAAHGEHGLPVLATERLLELLRARRVEPLAHDEGRRLLT